MAWGPLDGETSLQNAANRGDPGAFDELHRRQRLAQAAREDRPGGPGDGGGGGGCGSLGCAAIIAIVLAGGGAVTLAVVGVLASLGLLDPPTSTTTEREWAGTLTCADGTRGVRMVTSASKAESGPDQVTAVVWYYPVPFEEGASQPTAEGRSRLRGTLDGVAFDLASDGEPAGAPPFTITRLVGQMAEDGSRLDAFVESAQCSAINLRRR